jgi:DNA-binding transcriptional ArsR family regulator
MVEQQNKLDAVFQSLSDPTRRSILKVISKKSLSVGQIAIHYQLTFAGVAKHLDVLHRAQLITKRRVGKEQIVSISPQTLASANKYLDSYKQLWENRLESLDDYLKLTNNPKKGKRNGTNQSHRVRKDI